MKMFHRFHAFLASITRGQAAGMPTDEENMDAQWAWSISARLAGVQSIDADPEAVANLIHEAKELHAEWCSRSGVGS